MSEQELEAVREWLVPTAEENWSEAVTRVASEILRLRKRVAELEINAKCASEGCSGRAEFCWGCVS